MTEQQVTMSGLASLRMVAKDLRRCDWPDTAAHLEQLAVLWEQDLNYAAGLIADATLRAERAEAALERAANDLMLSEESFVQMRAKRDDVLRELHTTQAALERARALENKRAVSARNVAEWVRGLWADYCRQSGEAGVSVIMNQEILEKLKRARALLKKTEFVYSTEFLDYYCDTCGNNKRIGHAKNCELAAVLAEGGRP